MKGSWKISRSLVDWADGVAVDGLEEVVDGGEVGRRAARPARRRPTAADTAARRRPTAAARL